jgi:hypothetical protein
MGKAGGERLKSALKEKELEQSKAAKTALDCTAFVGRARLLRQSGIASIWSGSHGALLTELRHRTLAGVSRV